MCFDGRQSVRGSVALAADRQEESCTISMSCLKAASEAALAHNVGSSTEVAYARAALFDQRRVLMQQWAEFCAG